MISTTIRTSFKTLLAATVVSAALLAAAPAQAELSKQDVEKIVEEYIRSNPQVILDSVDKHQRESMERRQSDAVKANHDMLFKNERSPFIGNPDGDVTVVEFFDYNCGYCKRAFNDLQKVVDQDKNVKIVFKEFPILGPTSETASRWALAAQKQNKYFDFHTKMMSRQGPITEETLAEVAKEIGADVDKMRADAGSTEVMIQIEKNRALASQMNIGGTPAFVIGNEIIPGAISANGLLEKIKEQRAEKAEKKDAKKE